ncbi:hypothetical protein RvY_16167 [Ramazzottius varieornatus]|uniref:SEA domain-containing protein n=1 Tax=Ramazzottius varieornatus TaxID=947166 RepID=A0A1D1VYW0_RAMVA|nr:hypothetical protein RvY_16167 [Ramazzottius varieornatus]
MLLFALFIFLAISCVSGARFIAQGRVTENDIVKLDDSVSDLSGGDRQPIMANTTETPLVIQPSTWSFTLADAVLLAYASTNDRDVALQQLTQVWEDALAPMVTDVQVVLVNDEPDLTNPTDFADNSTASIVTYAVLGNSPSAVDQRDAKEKFRSLLSFTRIPVIPINTTQEGNLFAFLESIGLTYTNDTQRDDLLQSIKEIWSNLLGPIATNIQLTLYNEASASSGTISKHFITYIISGNSSVRLTSRDFEPSFRQLLLASRLVGHGVWGISIAGPTLTSLSDASVSSTTTTLRPSTTEYSVPAEPFEITDSVLLPYDNAAQVIQLLQQIKQLWISVLGPRFVFRDIRFVNSTLQNMTVSGVVTLVYDITYEMSGLTDAKVHVENVRTQFHQEALRVLAPDGTVPVAIVHSFTQPTPEATSTVTIGSPLPNVATAATTSASANTDLNEKDFFIVSPDLPFTPAPSVISTTEFVAVSTKSSIGSSTAAKTAAKTSMPIDLTTATEEQIPFGASGESVTTEATTPASTSLSTRPFVSNGFTTRWVVLPGVLWSKSQTRQNAAEIVVRASSSTSTATTSTTTSTSTTTVVTTTKVPVTITAPPTTTTQQPATSTTTSTPPTTRPTTTTTRATTTTSTMPTTTSTTSTSTTTTPSTTMITTATTPSMAPSTKRTTTTVTTTSTAPTTSSTTHRTTLVTSSTHPTTRLTTFPSTRIIYFTTAKRSTSTTSSASTTTTTGGSRASLEAKQGVMAQTNSTTRVPTTTIRRKNVKGSPELDALATLAAEKLIRTTLAGSGLAQVHSAVFFENIMLQLASTTTIPEAMDDLRITWLDAFGNETEDVKLAVYHNTTIRPVNSSEIPVTNIDYVVLVLGKLPDINVEAARVRFLQLLANNTRTLELLTRRATTTTTTVRPASATGGAIGDASVHNNVILDSVSISADATSTEREQLLKALQIIWMDVVGRQAQDIQVSIYREAPHAGPLAGNEQLIDLFYIVLVKSTSPLELDVDGLRATADRLVSRIAMPGLTILTIPERSQFVHEVPNNSSSSLNFTTPKRDSTGPLLGFALPNTILLNYTSESERSTVLESVLNVWKDVFGFNQIDVRLVVSNDSTIDVDGGLDTSGTKVHYVTYTVFVITNATNYDQEKITAEFNQRLVKANLPSVILDTSSNSVTELTAQRNSPHSNITEIALQTIQPDSIESYVFDNVIEANYSTDAERDAVFEALTKMWIDFMGKNAVDVQIRPYFDVANATTGSHRLSYMVLILTHQRGWNIDVLKSAFHQYLSSPETNHTQLLTYANSSVSANDRREDLIVIPAGLSVSYSTPQELVNMLQVIQNLWQRVLGSNATSVDITLYSDVVNRDLSLALGTSTLKQIHDISYVVIIQTNQSHVDIPLLRAQFENLLPGMSISSSQNSLSNLQPTHILTHFDYTANSSSATLKEALLAPPLPSGFVLSDYIWLVYNNTKDRDDYLNLMATTWTRILSGENNATNVTVVFDHEVREEFSKDTPPDSHKVLYYVLAVVPAEQSINSTFVKRRFRHELPHENFLFGFDMDDDDNNQSSSAL